LQPDFARLPTGSLLKLEPVLYSKI
jgi:hypothetical protein